MTNWISEKRGAAAAMVVAPADSDCWPASKEPLGERNGKCSTVQQEGDLNLTAALQFTWNDGRYFHFQLQGQRSRSAPRNSAFYYLPSGSR